MIGEDLYYSRPEVSHSDLLAIDNLFSPIEKVIDLTRAYREGNLIDCMVTEAHRCDHILKKVDDEQFSEAEWDNCYAMLNSLRKDAFFQKIFPMSTGQQVFSEQDFKVNYQGFEFSFPARIKYDWFLKSLGYGGDLKSTAATSQQQFQEAFNYFNYASSRTFYMDISKSDKDFVLGVSKKPPHKVFKIFINRGDDIYNLGKERYSELAFRYFTLFSNFFND